MGHHVGAWKVHRPRYPRWHRPRVCVLVSLAWRCWHGRCDDAFGALRNGFSTEFQARLAAISSRRSALGDKEPGMARRVTHRYHDPLDLVWLAGAARLGMRVERSAEVYASWDGASVLTLSTPGDFDPDDSLAQLIYHEICHSLVAGPRGQRLPDWGLSNTDDSDLVYEHACHRVQAALAAPYGLRDFFAVTTEWRPYWDSLPSDTLADGEDPAIPLAREGYRRAQLEPMRSVLRDALERTARLAAIVHELPLDGDALWTVAKRRHPTGLLMADVGRGTCGECAWVYGNKVLRCRRSASNPEDRAVVERDWPGCESFEAPLLDASCRSCGACCREGYDRVELRRGDVVRKRHPALVSVDGAVAFIARPDGKCRGLSESAGCYTCEIYEDRPKACAELEPGGDACLSARRRVGLTR